MASSTKAVGSFREHLPPKELLPAILSFLDPNDRIQAVWATTAKDASGKRAPSAREVVRGGHEFQALMNGSLHLQQRFRETPRSHGEPILKLHLSDPKHTDDQFRDLLTHNPKVTKLHLSTCPEIHLRTLVEFVRQRCLNILRETDPSAETAMERAKEGVRLLCEGTQELRTLFGEGKIEEIFQAAPQNSPLYIAIKRYVQSKLEFESALKKMGDTEGFVSLEFSGCPFVNDDDLQELLEFSPHLHTLRIMNCFSITGRILPKISKLCPSLHTLDFSFRLDIEEADLIAFAQNKPKVRTLKLNNCENAVTDASIEAIFGNCSLLDTLEVAFCPKLKGRNVQAVCPSLRTLNVRGSWNIEDLCIIPFVQRCPNLQDIDIAGTDLGEYRPREIWLACPRLRRMKTFSGEEVTDPRMLPAPPTRFQKVLAAVRSRITAANICKVTAVALGCVGIYFCYKYQNTLKTYFSANS